MQIPHLWAPYGKGSELNDCIGSPVSTSFIEWMPPPAEWVGYRCVRLVESKFISRLGDCSSGPQQLMYVCTWEWLIESKSMLKRGGWMRCACCQCTIPACPEMSGDVGDGWVGDCSALPCVAVSWLSQVMVHCQVGTCVTRFHQIKPWQSVTLLDTRGIGLGLRVVFLSRK